MTEATLLRVPAPSARSLAERTTVSADFLGSADLFARFWIVSCAAAMLTLTASKLEPTQIEATTREGAGEAPSEEKR
jgi:hypothetical protein